MTERWLPVVGFEGAYEVSDLGRVRSLERWARIGENKRRVAPAILKPRPRPNGYPMVTLTKPGGVRKSLMVHRIVALAFLGPCPAGMVACHNDGSRTNSVLGNLRYGTNAGNLSDKLIHGTSVRGVAHAMAKLDSARVTEIRDRAGENQYKLAREYGVNQAQIWRILNRKSWAWL